MWAASPPRLGRPRAGYFLRREPTSTGVVKHCCDSQAFATILVVPVNRNAHRRLDRPCSRRWLYTGQGVPGLENRPPCPCTNTISLAKGARMKRTDATAPAFELLSYVHAAGFA